MSENNRIDKIITCHRFYANYKEIRKPLKQVELLLFVTNLGSISIFKSFIGKDFSQSIRNLIYCDNS
ncbi:hypothetical protein OSCI_1100012 [Kamptonema sp. PCC 6506]|nr:hypothetical protein OSCI_1100012 [Kamptonema sp. PCC 6506]